MLPLAESKLLLNLTERYYSHLLGLILLCQNINIVLMSNRYWSPEDI